MTTAPTIKDRTASTFHDTGHDTERGRAFLEIRTYHSTHAKALRSSVRRVTRTAISTGERFAFGEVDPVPAASARIARYSEKALIAAHAEYITAHNLEDPAELARLIEWAKGA